MNRVISPGHTNVSVQHLQYPTADNPLAHPVSLVVGQQGSAHLTVIGGMTQRDHFASLFLAAMVGDVRTVASLAETNPEGRWAETAAALSRKAVELADALREELRTKTARPSDDP